MGFEGVGENQIQNSNCQENPKTKTYILDFEIGVLFDFGI